MSVEKQIKRSIKNKDRGTLIFPGDFLDIGTSDAVRQSLKRLADKEFIVRVAHGIYVRPKINRLIGAIIPSAEEVAKAIAKRDKIRTIPSGNYALNILGLSTQVPMNIVLLTDGSPRELSVGNRKIKFKRTTPKNLLARGEVSRLVIQALKTIGEGKVTPEEEEKIISLLKRDDQEDLHHDILLAPVWIQKIMRKALVNVQD